MNRRSFLKGFSGGLAAVVAAPVLAKQIIREDTTLTQTQTTLNPLTMKTFEQEWSPGNFSQTSDISYRHYPANRTVCFTCKAEDGSYRDHWYAFYGVLPLEFHYRAHKIYNWDTSRWEKNREHGVPSANELGILPPHTIGMPDLTEYKPFALYQERMQKLRNGTPISYEDIKNG